MNTKPHTATKFTFDTEFRSGTDAVSNAARGRIRKSLTQDEIDEMCAKAREAGIKSGQVRAQEAIAAAIAALSDTMRQTLDNSSADIAAVRAEAARLALACAAKLAGATLKAAAMEEITRVLGDAILQAIGEPRITLRAAPKVAAALEEQIEAIAHEQGYEGRIHLTADPSLPDADCRIEWRGGGAERRQDAIEADIAAVIARHYSHIPTTSGTKG